MKLFTHILGINPFKTPAFGGGEWPAAQAGASQGIHSGVWANTICDRKGVTLDIESTLQKSIDLKK